MPNVDKIISAHNKSILKKNNEHISNTEKTCNCRRKAECPLEGNCLTKGVIYQATVTRVDNNKEETYVGLTENNFKTRYNGHICSFRHSSKRNSTTLSNYIWKLKDDNIQHSVKWKVLAKGSPYSTATKSCSLCLKEKFIIICKPHLASLNIRNELVTEC